MPATATRMSIEEYLALPEDGPPWLEYIDGEVVEKPVGNAIHIQIIERLLVALGLWTRLHGGKSGSDGRSRFPDPDDPRAMLPDISYFRPGVRFSNPDLTLNPPTFAIEVRSPGQTLNHQRARAFYYRAHGVEEVWLVDAERGVIEVWDGVRNGEQFTSGTVDSRAVPGFSVDLGTLFEDLAPEFA